MTTLPGDSYLPGESYEPPDLEEIESLNDLMQELRRFRIWNGEPPWREMDRILARARGHTINGRPLRPISYVTLCSMTRSKYLPRLDNVLAFVVACGGSDAELSWFAQAWRRLRMMESVGQPPVRDRPPSS